MNVLVTGGTGVLGREVVRAAHAAGHRVVTMSRKPAPNAAAAPRWATAHLVTGEGLAAAVADVDVVIHAASDPRGDPAADEEGTQR
ncbi:MAG TPA: NAD-dependent epimerase/dehydratase family protein, partial [Pseudolysinimonas sp.]|nr:NAD-dependent epimerase/dehydratase family protein [Pseudolysinimonas sp.]